MMEQWRDDDEYVNDDDPHVVGFANLYDGEIYGECMCGWSTTLRDPEPELVRELVAEARGAGDPARRRGQRTAAGRPWFLTQTSPVPRRRRRSLRAVGRVKGEPSGSSLSDAQRP